MQSRTFCRGTPQVYRIVKSVPTNTRAMSLFPRTFGYPVSSVASPFSITSSLERDVAPLFRMVDDLSRNFDSNFFPFGNAASRNTEAVPFAPRFDVQELEGAYQLRGELPGVESSNLQVEFTDPHTLVIRGQTESTTTSGTLPTTIEAQTTKAVEAGEPVEATGSPVADDAASVHSDSSYHKATVEDEVIIENNDGASSPGQVTPATTEANTNSVATNVPAESKSAKYWVSERRTGSFQRVFNFSAKIDQDGVTASLKNGVLDITVPKVMQQAPKKITVQ